MLTFHIITLFPEMFDSYLGESMLKRAQQDKKVTVKFYNPRDYGVGKHKQVDDRPFGGGPGMVLQATPILNAVEAALKKSGCHNANVKKCKVIILSPGGKEFTNTYAQTLEKKYDHIILICGRYEGIDARVKKILKAQEVSIGDYVLTGGELPAMVMVDSVTRQIDDVLGNNESLEEKRVASHEMYTRPEVLEWEGKKYRAPKILLSGDHKKIEEWRFKK